MDNNLYSLADDNVGLMSLLIDARDGTVRDLTSHGLISQFAIPVGGFADAFKFSNRQNVSAHNFEVWGGYEDCVDVNRGRKIQFVHGTCHILGKYGFTLKGGLDDYLLDDIVFTGKPSEYHIEIGNWSDQAQGFGDKTRNGLLRNVRCEDGSKVIVHVLNGDVPKVENCPNIEFVTHYRPTVWVFWTLRRNKWAFTS